MINDEELILFLKDNKLFNEWYSYVKDILKSEEFEKRKLYIHHDDSVYHHCILVSFKSFIMAKKIHANEMISAIAGLLHDFYPKAWQYNEELYKKYPECLRNQKSIFKMHGFVHAKEASKNYQIYYPNIIDKKITNAIKYHMFPLTIVPPLYIEGWIVTLADKMITIKTINIKTIPKLIGLKEHEKIFQRKTRKL